MIVNPDEHVPLIVETDHGIHWGAVDQDWFRLRTYAAACDCGWTCTDEVGTAMFATSALARRAWDQHVRDILTREVS